MFNDVKFSKELHLPGNLVRFEFLEVLVRCAKTRFVQAGDFDNVADALEHLITEFILKNYPDEDYATFREQKLWNLEISDMYIAN